MDGFVLILSLLFLGCMLGLDCGYGKELCFSESRAALVAELVDCSPSRRQVRRLSGCRCLLSMLVSPPTHRVYQVRLCHSWVVAWTSVLLFKIDTGKTHDNNGP